MSETPALPIPEEAIERAKTYVSIFINVMEWSGPAAVDRILRVAEREGIWCALRDDGGYDHRHCYATLDIRSEDGVILDDQCIPTPEAFAWWARAVELRADMADCPVDEPEVHALTYARAGGA